MKTHFKKLLFAGLIVTFFGCDTEENLPLVDEQLSSIEEQNVSDPELNEFLRRNNLSISSSNIEEIDGFYILDGCLKVLKQDLSKNLEGDTNGRTQQSYTNSYVTVSPGAERTITYKIDGSVPTSGSNNWRPNIEAAMMAYSSIRNFNITFQQITSGTADITISGGYYSSNGVAWGSWTSSGNPGSSITINFNYSSSVFGNQRTFILAHEVGHNLGFRHTNWISAGEPVNNPSEGLYGGNLVPATFGNDPISIMNTGPSYPTIPYWTDFPHTDLLAIRYIYSKDASEKPFYAYLTNYGGQGGWTTNWSLHGYGDANYPEFRGVNGYIYTSSKAGTIPLYMYKDLNTNLEYMSTDPNLSITYPNWTKLNTLGYVFNSSGTNRLPVYEYFNYTTGYYFTTLANDPTITGPGWIGGGAAFYTMSLGS